MHEGGGNRLRKQIRKIITQHNSSFWRFFF